MSSIRLSPSARITETARGVMLCSDLGTFAVTGADVRVFLDRIVPLCDGTRDRAAIAAALPGYSPRSVGAFLDLLRDRGLLEEGESSGPGSRGRRRGQEAFLARFAQGEGHPAARLAGARVLVAGPSTWGEAAAVELAASGVGTIRRMDGDVLSAAPAADLLVAAIAPHDDAQIQRVARHAEDARVSCLWSHVAGGAAFVGLSVPRQTACRWCARAEAVNPRLAGEGEVGPGAALLPLVLGQMVALEAIKVITGYAPSSLAGRLLILDARTFETTRHTLVRLPGCAVCGSARRGAW